MTKHVPILLFVFILLLLLAGCNEPVRYADISTGMDSYEFLILYPDAEELPEVAAEDIAIQVFKRTPGNDKRLEYYFLSGDRVSTVIIIFNKDTDYSLISAELASANGPATFSTT